MLWKPAEAQMAVAAPLCPQGPLGDGEGEPYAFRVSVNVNVALEASPEPSQGTL